MKGLLIWFGTLGLLLSLLGIWGAYAGRAARSVDPSIYTEAMEPELPAIPEVQPDTPETGPAFTF